MEIRKELSEQLVRALSSKTLYKVWCFLLNSEDVVDKLEEQGVISFNYEKCLKLIDNESNLKTIMKHVNKASLGGDDFKKTFEYVFDLYYYLMIVGSEVAIQILEAYTNIDQLKVVNESKVLH